MRKLKKHVSTLLAVLMFMSLLPTSVWSAAAADAYHILFQPSTEIKGTLINAADDHTATIWADVYQTVYFTGNDFVYTEYSWGDGNYTKPDEKIKPRYNSTTKKYDYVDADGNVLFGGYDDAGYFYNGYARVEIGENWNDRYSQVIDKTGAVIFSDRGKNYEIEYGNITEGLIYVTSRDNYKKGVVNQSGELIVPMQYDEVKGAHNGYIAAFDVVGPWYERANGTLYDIKGNVVIPTGEYAWVSDVSSDGIVWARKGLTDVVILKISPDPNAPELAPDSEVVIPLEFQLNPIRDAEGKTINNVRFRSVPVPDAPAVGYSFSVDMDNSISGDLATVEVNGTRARIPTQRQTDSGGNVSYCFNLRDLFKPLGFDAVWTEEHGVTLTQCYNPYDR